jgi:hypothetical protein
MKNTTQSSSVTFANRLPGAKVLPGNMPASKAPVRSLWRPLTARKRTDSGRRSARKGASSSGVIPPTMNTERQPNCGIMAAAISPPSAAPTEKPQNIVITIVARRRCGLNSDVSATAFGIAPPSPRPVRKRMTIRLVVPVASVVASVPTPNATTLSTTMRLRPIRSASGPKMRAPIMRPNRPALKTGPRAPRGSAQSRTISGAT